MFAGSGSTGVACLNTNRKFIGIEKVPEYFDIGVKRMQESTIKGEMKWNLKMFIHQNKLQIYKYLRSSVDFIL